MFYIENDVTRNQTANYITILQSKSHWPFIVKYTWILFPHVLYIR